MELAVAASILSVFFYIFGYYFGVLAYVFTRESSYCFQRVLTIAILSICPSVHLSHGLIRQKRSKLGSPNLHRRLPGRL